MTVLDDIAAALETYPVDRVTVSITDVALHSGTPPVTNTNEIWRFQVLVENDGHINMTDVELHVLGDNDTTVSANPAGPFDGSLTTDPMNVNGAGSRKSSVLYFKAPPAAKPAGTTLVRAHVADWSMDFSNHYSTNHTPNLHAPSGVFAAQVFP
jgi:hypothetical protein